MDDNINDNENDNEDKLLRSVALQNAQAVLLARERAERELISAKQELERKSAELAEQREFFRVTLASIGDAVITTDTESRITFLNPVAEAMTGWNLAEALAQPLEKVFNIVNEKTRQPAVSPVARVLRKGAVVGLVNHTALIARDGRETAIDDSAAPIRDASGRITGVAMVFHDVTERRRTETALRESNQSLSEARDLLLEDTGSARSARNLMPKAVSLDEGGTFICIAPVLAISAVSTPTGFRLLLALISLLFDIFITGE